MRRVKRVDAPYRSGLSKVYKQMLIDAGIETTLYSKARKIPADPRSGCCSLGADRQSAGAEDRLSTKGVIPEIPIDNLGELMPQMGQSRHFGRRLTTSSLPPETDIAQCDRHV